MRKIILIPLILFSMFCFAQVKDFGTPYIKNFTKHDYKAGTQNWGICTDNKGFLYFANNDGLLCFDGVRWELNKVSDNSPVRSVFVDSNNRLFIGLINDFGILVRNESGPPYFKSLKYLLPPGIDIFNDIWQIHEIPQGIVFQTYNYLFLYKNNKIEAFKPQNQFHYSYNLNGHLYIHEHPNGIFEFKDGKLDRLYSVNEYSNLNISAVVDISNNELLICTSDQGVFITKNEKFLKWDTPVNKLLVNNKIYCATAISEHYYAFGTILNGLIIADSEGNVVQQINTSNGLQNNTILSIFVDGNKNLWLGLDNGIDYVEINSPLSFIGMSKEVGTGYCCAVFNEKLYLGTNQGLFVRPFHKSSNSQAFKLVENTAGQVWSLNVFDGQLICGHNRGTFTVENSKATKISDIEGAWKYIRLKNNPNYLLGGHFEGLVLLKKSAKGWEFYKKLTGFEESSRYLEQSTDGQIWISHGEKGVFRVKLNGIDSIVDTELYTAEKGLPTTIGNILFQFRNKPYISTNTGIYEYDKISNSFKVSEQLNALLDVEGQLKNLKTDNHGNVWFIADYEIGVLRYNQDSTYTKISLPFRKLSDFKVKEFEFIYPYDTENIFIGIENGFAHYASNYPKSYNSSFQAFITKVEMPYIDTVLYINQIESVSDLELPFRKNNLRFHFTTPFFENDAPLQFSYFLEDFSDEWSVWSTDSYKDFTRLHEGEYIFKLKAKNIYDQESEIATYSFVVLPPWYRTKLAYFLYVLGLIALFFLFKKIILRRSQILHEREKLQQQLEFQEKEALFQKQALIDEKEIIKLRNDKLRTEKLHRDKELANQTMGIVQKNRFLIKLNRELELLQSSSKDAQVRTKMSIIKKMIHKEIDNKRQNELFKTYFEEVHSEFFERLKKQYPKLSPAEIILCAYIRMNISTKEIATLLNISFKGAEIRRYRLRKKLDISRDVNLSTFLSNI